MELSPFFKSVLEQDRAPIVICDCTHTIIYMNPAAANMAAALPSQPRRMPRRAPQRPPL